jgi:hypothetical protein
LVVQELKRFALDNVSTREQGKSLLLDQTADYSGFSIGAWKHRECYMHSMLGVFDNDAIVDDDLIGVLL